MKTTQLESSRFRQHTLRWVIVLAGFPFATLVRLALQPFMLQGSPFLTYYPLVLLVAVVAGTWPAVLAMVLGGFAGLYLFVEPVGSIEPSLANVVLAITYFAINAISIIVIDRMDKRNQGLAASVLASESLAAERASAAAEALASRQRLDAVFWQLPVGIIETDLEGTMLLANERAAGLFGRRVEDLVGVPLSQILHIADRADLGHAIEQLVRGTPGLAMHLRPVSVGCPPLMLHFAMPRDAQGEPQSLLAAVEQASSSPPETVLGMPPKPWQRR